MVFKKDFPFPFSTELIKVFTSTLLPFLVLLFALYPKKKLKRISGEYNERRVDISDSTESQINSVKKKKVVLCSFKSSRTC